MNQSATPEPDQDNSTPELTRLEVDGREILLLGTAHISSESVEQVRRAIVQEKPDTVCVELDFQRHNSLRNRNRWSELNLFQVIRQGQAPFLLANLALASFQKRMGLQTGIQPGAELLAAVETAEQEGLHVALIDRNIRTTLLRAWRKTSLWRKLMLVATLVASLFEKQDIDEEELARLRQTDTLSAMLEEMGELMPHVKTILVDERDIYMAEKIRQAPGQKILAVIGAAHRPGIIRQLQQPADPDRLGELDEVPPKPALSKGLPWLIPAVVLLAFVLGFFYGDRSQMAGAAVAWVLANGLLSALGAVIAFGHPATVLSAFVAAPIT
ncbi:MAG: TraB/GumN family protein, partial [Deltaproteobacteria bacterium]